MTYRAFLLAGLIMSAIPEAVLAADYVIGRGDVLEVNVLNVPALHRRVTVGADGKLPIPPIGEVDAEGMSREQLQSALRELLARKNVASDPDVTVEVVEYRPVYISGDVAKPGEYRYRPDMTVRNAIATAGGLGETELRGVGRLLEAAGARGEVGALAVELATQEAKVGRLRAEVADRPELTVESSAEVEVSPVVLAEIKKTEIEQFAADRSNVQKEKAYFDGMIQASQKELEYLNNASQQQQRTLEQQTSDVARARDLLQRGIGTMSRAEDEQRAIALLQWQILDVKARMQQAQKELGTFTRQLETYDDQRKVRLLNELGAALSEVGKLGYRLRAARDKVRLAGGAWRRWDVVPEAAIHRAAGGSQQRLDASLDTALLPGDVLEIAVPSDSPPSTRAERP